MNIKCRASGLKPDAAVIVATVRALKMHGGGPPVVAGTPLPHVYTTPNPDLVAAGCANLSRHVKNTARYGVPVVVAINAFATDSAGESTGRGGPVGDVWGWGSGVRGGGRGGDWLCWCWCCRGVWRGRRGSRVGGSSAGGRGKGVNVLCYCFVQSATTILVLLYSLPQPYWCYCTVCRNHTAAAAAPKGALLCP